MITPTKKHITNVVLGNFIYNSIIDIMNNMNYENEYFLYMLIEFLFENSIITSKELSLIYEMDIIQKHLSNSNLKEKYIFIDYCISFIDNYVNELNYFYSYNDNEEYIAFLTIQKHILRKLLE